tara:strand:- start:1128 stop:1763 length:636 start_codon:yes stop_codon:yes gene_type:complete
MINLQIRGTKSEISIGSITDTKKDRLLNEIKEKKISLAELMMLKKKDRYSDIYSGEMPIVSNQSEFIATSFDEKNYYDDGYSFFRAQVNSLSDKAGEIGFKHIETKFIIVNYLVYFGCVYETEIDNLNYDEFEEDRLGIETITIPFLEKQFIKRVTYNRVTCSDLNRSKVQLIKFNSILCGTNTIDKNPTEDENISSEFEIIIYSEKDFNN